MRVFEKRMLRKILGPTRKELARGCSRMHNEELHYMYT
jgi:hypothetical protein